MVLYVERDKKFAKSSKSGLKSPQLKGNLSPET